MYRIDTCVSQNTYRAVSKFGENLENNIVIVPEIEQSLLTVQVICHCEARLIMSTGDDSVFSCCRSLHDTRYRGVWISEIQSAAVTVS